MPSSPFIVAELSANHLGSLDRALAMVDMAAQAGADAIKLQTWGRMVVDPTYRIQDGPWAGQRLADLYVQAKTPETWHEPLFDRAQKLGMVGFTSVFDIESLWFLESLDCPMYKIASFELLDLPLIKAVAATGKPLVLSTGMSTFAEVEDAVLAAVEAGCRDLTVLKCTSAYPARAADANLATMEDLRMRFGCKVAVSDHTLGRTVAVAATVLGADMIEKHLTVKRQDGGPDAGFSMEASEFAEMVSACRNALEAIGRPHYEPTALELPQRPLRRSLWWDEDGDEGNLPPRMVTARPGMGMAPKHRDTLTLRRLRRDVRAGTPVRPEDFN